MTASALLITALSLLGSPLQVGDGALAIVVSAPSLGPDAAFAAETKLLTAAEQSGIELVLRDETRIHLQAMRAMGNECAAVDCLADVGGAANAGRVLFVRAGSGTVEASLIDVITRAQLGAMTTAAPDGLEPETAARVVRALLTPKVAGSLVLLVEPNDATVSVAGERVVPGTRIDGLAAGAHALEASRDGFAPYQADVVVVAGTLTPHEVRLEPLPEGGQGDTGVSPMLLGGTGAGLLLGGLVIGLTGGVLGYVMARGAVTSQLPPGATTQELDDAVQASEAWGGVAVASALIGAALVVGGAAVATAALFTEAE